MIDKSLNVFFIMLLAAGGIMILVMTWVQPIPISERIVPSFFGVMGVILALIWSLISRSKSAKVRVTGIPDKTSVKKENY